MPTSSSAWRSATAAQVPELTQQVDVLRRTGVLHTEQGGVAALEHPRSTRVAEHPGEEPVEHELAQDDARVDPAPCGNDLRAGRGRGPQRAAVLVGGAGHDAA